MPALSRVCKASFCPLPANLHEVGAQGFISRSLGFRAPHSFPSMAPWSVNPLAFSTTHVCCLLAVCGHRAWQGLFATLTDVAFKWSSHVGLSVRRGPGGPRPQQLQLWQQLLMRHQGQVPVLAWILQRKRSAHIYCARTVCGAKGFTGAFLSHTNV